jgi:O-antigen/teichoic acid export membrane protein
MENTLSSSRTVVHNAVYNVLGFGASALYVLLLVPLIVSHLGLDQFGIWSLMIALTGYLSMADLGLGTSFVKYVAEYFSLRDYGRVNGVLYLGLLFYGAVSLAMLAIGYAAFPLLFHLLNIPTEQYDLARTTFLLSLVGFGFASLSAVFGSILTGLQRNDVYNLVQAVMFALKLAVAAWTLEYEYGLTGLMVGDTLVTIVMMVVMAFAARRTFRPLSIRKKIHDRGMLKTLFGFGAKIQITRLADMVQTQFDKLLITRFVGLPFVSLYDFGSRPLTRVRMLPLTALASMLPAVSALDAEDNVARIRAATLRSTRYLFVAGLPLFTFAACFAHELIDVWLGTGYDRSALTMQILAVPFFLNVAAAPLAYVAQGKGEPHYQMYANLGQIIVNVVLSTVLVLRFGYFGAVAGTTIAITLGNVVFVGWYGKRVFDEPMRLLWSVLRKPLACIIPSALTGLGLVYAGRSLLGFQTRPALALLLAFAGAAFLSLYGFLVFKAKVFSSDDKGFLVGVIPGRFRHLLRVE